MARRELPQDEDRSIIELLMRGAEEVRWVDILSSEFLDQFEVRQSGPIDAVPTFLPSWNTACGDDGGGVGLAHGWLVVLGGNPGTTKTLTALTLARDALLADERPAFVSLEMHHAQLGGRFFSMAAQVEVKRLERGRFDPAALDEVRAAMRRLFPRGGLYTNVGLIFDLVTMLEHMVALHENQGVRFFVVDYLQLITVGDEEHISAQVAKAVRALRAFAVRFSCVVVLCTQFNRNTSNDFDHSPRIQGCHGGAAIEQSVDQGMLVDHSRYDRTPHGARTWMMTGKNKHGAYPEIAIEWDFKTLRCREAMPDEVEDGWTAKDREKIEASASRKKTRSLRT